MTAAGVVRVLFCCVMAVMMPEHGLFWIVLLMVLSGLTFGISGGPSSARIIEHAPEGEGGTGSVVMMLSQYSGMVVGVALYALVFNLAARVGRRGRWSFDDGCVSAGFSHDRCVWCGLLGGCGDPFRSGKG